MTPINTIYSEMGIRETVLSFGNTIEKDLKKRFEKIDKIAEYNQLKVVKAMQDNRVSAGCFNYASGYGYDDQGRDTLEKVYASIFHTESALVRPQITCGTHALALALAANLRPGDELLAPAGKPYDTLEEVIGIRPSNGSLAEYGITYSQVDLLEDGTFDYENIEKAINEKTKMVAIQRSKGYQTRPSFSVGQIGELIAFVKRLKPDLICMVDNCYGEFVETIEPSDVVYRGSRRSDRCMRIPTDFPGPRKRGWCISWYHERFLPGIIPCPDSGSSCTKRCDLCS